MPEADLPRLPRSQYRVHDAQRPLPPALDPPASGAQVLPGAPPADAVVLFDGSGPDGWRKVGGDGCDWRVDHGALCVVPGTGDHETERALGSGHYHVEFACPEKIEGKSGQQLGNSGVFVMGLYEFQILDSYENPTYADGVAGAIYGQQPPQVNPSRPPGQWQSMDILFEAPAFSGDDVERPAYATAFLNGVLIHCHVALLGPTTHRDVAAYAPHESERPVRLQDHGDEVRFRNIWFRPFVEVPQ